MPILLKFLSYITHHLEIFVKKTFPKNGKRATKVALV